MFKKFLSEVTNTVQIVRYHSNYKCNCITMLKPLRGSNPACARLLLILHKLKEEKKKRSEFSNIVLVNISKVVYSMNQLVSSMGQ